MDTKLFYTDHIWKTISSHPKYDLGQREITALIRFLLTVAVYAPQALDVLHLASSTGREVAALVSAIPRIQKYLLTDIVSAVVEKSQAELQIWFPQVSFSAVAADIETSGVVTKLRQRLLYPTLIALVANGVIFSNRQMDSNILEAMGMDDLFLLTVEETHPEMFDSYTIAPVFELLSQSGRRVTIDTVQVRYDDQTSTMHMACEGEDLLVSYKPTLEQLHQRMTDSGFVEIAVERYADLHMLAGLYRRA